MNEALLIFGIIGIFWSGVLCERGCRMMQQRLEDD